MSKENKEKGGIIGILIIVVVIAVVGAIAAQGLNSDDTVSTVNQAQNAKQQIEDAQKVIDVAVEMVDGDTSMDSSEGMEKEMMKKEEVAMPAEEVQMASSGQYLTYSPEALAAADGKKLVFFHADWCGSCRGLDANLEKEISAIPGDVTIFKADYEVETALKQKYGVTTQHTLVQIDDTGNVITKWSGGQTLGDLLARLQ